MAECVYRHTAPDGRMYIGIAKEPATVRWAKGCGYKSNPDFWKCICDVGWDNITHEIIASGLTREDAIRLEEELIKKHNTLIPSGFNRRLDDGHSKYRKVEVGRKYGHGTVVNYWPDKNGYKVYLLECECGNRFRCHVFDLTDDTSCGCKAQTRERRV